MSTPLASTSFAVPTTAPSASPAAENTAARYRRPSPLRRAAANFTDFAIWAGCALGAGLLAAIVLPGEAGAIGFLMAIPGATLLFGVVQIALLSRGQTVGKRLLKERVLVEHTREPAGLLRMFFRETIGKMISGLFLGIGYWWILFDRRGQGWHDKLVGTVVQTTAE
jgi:uncharacterized RDD family membrane protein YckC